MTRYNDVAGEKPSPASQIIADELTENLQSRWEYVERHRLETSHLLLNRFDPSRRLKPPDPITTGSSIEHRLVGIFLFLATAQALLGPTNRARLIVLSSRSETQAFLSNKWGQRSVSTFALFSVIGLNVRDFTPLLVRPDTATWVKGFFATRRLTTALSDGSVLLVTDTQAPLSSLLDVQATEWDLSRIVLGLTPTSCVVFASLWDLVSTRSAVF